jgi:hypothetical protein
MCRGQRIESVGVASFAHDRVRLASVDNSGSKWRTPSAGSSQGQNRWLRLYPRSNGYSLLASLFRLSISILTVWLHPVLFGAKGVASFVLISGL